MSTLAIQEFADTKAPKWLQTMSSMPFACTECGKCCQRKDGDVYMSDKEVSKAAQFLNMDETTFIQTYSDHVLYDDNRNMIWLHMKNNKRTNNADDADGSSSSCVFLNEETKHCQIYPARPLQCIAYPFYPDLLSSPQNWNEECRRRDDDLESPLPAWTPATMGCEGMRPIDSTDTYIKNDDDEEEKEGFPMDKVYELLYKYQRYERDMYSKRRASF